MAANTNLTNCLVAFYARLKTHPVLASLWIDHLEQVQTDLNTILAQGHLVEQLMAAGIFPDMDLMTIAAYMSFCCNLPKQSDHKKQLIGGRKRLNTI